MKPVEIKKGIYSVGVIDWNVRSFHGHTYTTKRGTTYNSYLIVDDKITLVDTVHKSFTDEFIDNIRQIVPVEKIDYVIANHVEPDHSGSMPAIMKLAPKAKVFGTQKCKDGLFRYYYENWDFTVVKTGDKLPLGKRTLSFIEAPMIHWPDSMFTYCAEEALLMPNDAFGQHIATSERFADEIDRCALMEEAAKYYANILWPLSSLITKKIDDIVKMNLRIDMIAPSHGVIWRKDPMEIVNKYAKWAKNETTKKVVIAYETMWGATEKMAKAIADGLVSQGISVKIYNVAETDATEIATDMLDAKGFIFGSSTHDNDMLNNIAGFLQLFKGFKPKNRIAAAFGSHGWAGGGVKEIEEVVKSAGIEIAQPSLAVKFMPDGSDIKQCFEFGVEFAKKM
jgi:anaerobic nitric oxide reductase flavorubredoxin